MAIDGVNQLSNEQLLAMNMTGNGQVTNDTDSSDSTSSETNLAFQLMMENLKNSAKTSKQSNVDKVDQSQKDSNSNDAKTENLDAQNNNSESTGKASWVAQTYATGQKLEDIPMILRNGYVCTQNSELLSANRSEADIQKIYSSVDSAAKKYGVDSKLILAIIKQESDFDPNSTSGVGAAGLMQVMPENFSSLGVTDQYDINQNVDAGTKLFKEYLDQYGGNTEMALMAYNGGPGTMERRGVSSANDLYKMPKETQDYVPKVMGYYRNGV
ncbi:lytic transglycosylase domain-containing protein [Clostridium sp.]|uniref:lytic transglycosylase domain-containing protein n=1 Tax=Clostridium sp. TaxID=1506 RepID=UPI00283D106E|nr:lytic transglycosylase domain-containing protein [Clostridium sp.]MDR3596593.1 lytic transglycosylase domain-containing protein [Clostridium sp.]